MRAKITKKVGAGVPGGIAAAGIACTLPICPIAAPFVGLGLYLASEKDVKDKAVEYGSDDAAQQVLDEWCATRKVGESKATVSITKPYGTVRYHVKAEDFEDHDLARAGSLVELVALLNSASFEKREDIKWEILRKLEGTSDIVDVAQAYQDLPCSPLEFNFQVTLMQMASRETSISRLQEALDCLGYGKITTRDHIDTRISHLRS